MCEPTTIILIGTAVAGAISSFASVSAKNASIEAAGRQAENRVEEIQAEASQKIGERVRKARRDRARATVAAGEVGVGGQSFGLQLANITGQGNQDAGVIATSARFGIRDTLAQLDSARAGAPTAITAGLQIASGALSGASQGAGLSDSLRGLSIKGT